MHISLSPQRSATRLLPYSLGCGQFPAEDRDVSFSFTSGELPWGDPRTQQRLVASDF